MSDVKRCPCRGSNEMCGCQNGPHPVRQDPEAEITALRARLEAVEKERDDAVIKRAAWELESKMARAEVARICYISLGGMDMTNSTDNPLKPCPFCGGEAHIYETSQDSDTQVQAQCRGCGAEIAFWLPWTAGAGQKAAAWADVISRWNRRADLAPDPLADARVARMIDALRYYADPKTYEPDKRYANEPWPIFDDEGAMARAALAALSPTGGNADG